MWFYNSVTLAQFVWVFVETFPILELLRLVSYTFVHRLHVFFCETIPIDFDNANWNFQMNLSCTSARSVPNCWIFLMWCRYLNVFHRELLPVYDCPLTASQITENWDTFEEWFRKWRIIVNEDKSAHISFDSMKSNI